MKTAAAIAESFASTPAGYWMAILSPTILGVLVTIAWKGSGAIKELREALNALVTSQAVVMTELTPIKGDLAALGTEQQTLGRSVAVLQSQVQTLRENNRHGIVP